MNIKGAIKRLKSGKKIRRKTWQEGHFWRLDIKGNLCERGGKILDDWEICEERDDWDIDHCKEDSRLVSGKGKIVVSMIAVETLKRKILEDINNVTTGIGVVNRIKENIIKRFGF